MGPIQPDWAGRPPETAPEAVHGYSCTDHYDDEVKRCKAFITRHPQVSVLSPRATGTGLYHATWPEGAEGVIRLATHEELEPLLDYLETRFDR